jgi:PAS domain S-box-containing protein
LKNIITKRLLLYILLFSFFLTLGLTAIQLYLNYRQDVVNIKQKIELIRVINMDNLKTALLTLNQEAIALQFEGILRSPDIVHLIIKDQQGKILAQAGMPQMKDSLTSDFLITQLARGQKQTIGSFHVTATLSGVYKHVWATGPVVLFSQAIKILLIAFCIFFIFQRLVSRDLLNLIEELEAFDPVEDDLIFHHKPSSVIKNDVYHRLVGSINSMQKTLQSSKQALHSTLKIFERAQEVTKIGNWAWDLKRDVTTWSDELCRIIGITEEEYEGTYEIYLSCIHPEDKKSFQALTKRILTEKGLYHAEYRIVRKSDGAVRYVREDGLVTMDTDGSPSSILGSIQDITERKKAEDSLRESEERFRTLVENVPGIVFRCKLQAPWQVEHISEGVYTLTGYTQRDFLEGRVAFRDIIIIEDLALVGKTVEDGITGFRAYEVEYSLNHADGSIRFFHEKGRAVYDAEKNPLWLDGVVIDISDRRRAEEEKSKLLKQLLHAQKSDAIGTLAGGIAHDFNNILSAIMGYTELVLLDFQGRGESYQNLKQVYAAAIRARELIRQILTFSRTSEEKTIPQDLGLIVHEALKLLRSSLPTSIEIVEDIDTECRKVLADTTQIHQIVMNLCTNAFHAMEKNGGTLSIELHQVRLTEADLRNGQHHEPGDYVRLIVRDTGQGIAKENLDRIFEPYYTTKKQGRGTGLGLALVQGIVHSHNGMLSLQSEEREGTEFTIFFPTVSADVLVSQQEDVIEVLSGGSEHILVVDDEAPIAQMVKIMLERLGYNVTLFTSSLEALDQFTKKSNAFDLLITDQTMPGLVGVELTQKVLQLRPDLPVILCTGYSSQVSDENYLTKGIGKLLMKPVKINTLASGIRALLDNR